MSRRNTERRKGQKEMDRRGGKSPKPWPAIQRVQDEEEEVEEEEARGDGCC